MNLEKNTLDAHRPKSDRPRRFPCHIYGINDWAKAPVDLHCDLVKPEDLKTLKREIRIKYSVQLLSFLLTLFFLVCPGAPAAAEVPAALEYSMELSKIRFSAPETIYISISVTNSGDRETDGPISLYYPDGTIVEEFGSPILKAGGSLQWIGQWRVTRRQLKDGKISFTVRYGKDTGEKNKDGEPIMTNDAAIISKRIQYDAPAWEEEYDLLQTLDDFLDCWRKKWPDDMLDLCSPAWRSTADDPQALLSHYLQDWELRTWETENISGPEEDGYVTATVFASMKRNGGITEEYCRLTIWAVQENGKWYIDPAGITDGVDEGNYENNH